MNFFTGQLITIPEFEGIPETHATITEVGEDYLQVLTLDGEFAELYEAMWEFLTPAPANLSAAF